MCLAGTPGALGARFVLGRHKIVPGPGQASVACLTGNCQGAYVAQAWTDCASFESRSALLAFRVLIPVPCTT